LGNEKKPEDLYTEIRKYHLLRGLVHGLKWIIVRNSIPRTPQLEYNTMVKTLKDVNDMAPEIISEIEVLNTVTGNRYTAREILLKERVLRR